MQTFDEISIGTGHSEWCGYKISILKGFAADGRSGHICTIMITNGYLDLFVKQFRTNFPVIFFELFYKFSVIRKANAQDPFIERKPSLPLHFLPKNVLAAELVLLQ